MGTLPTTLIQIFCDIILNFQIVVKRITDLDGSFKRDPLVLMVI